MLYLTPLNWPQCHWTGLLSLRNCCTAQLLGCVQAYLSQWKKKKNPPVNYQLDKRKSCIQIASKGNCKYLLRNKTEHNFLLCIQNWKQNKKILLNFSSHTAVKTTKLLLIKKSMLKDSKGNCSHVNGNQLQSTLVLYQSHPQTLFL